MSRLEILRALVEERLTSAAGEIFAVFEKTIKVYEEEITHQRELLDVLKPAGIHIKDVLPPRRFVSEENIPSEPLERSPILGHDDPLSPQVKDQQEDLWTDQEEARLQELEEVNIMRSTIPVKNEHVDTEKPQPLQISQIPNVQTRETSPIASTSAVQMKIEPDLWDCGASGADVRMRPTNSFELMNGGQLVSDGSETDDSGDEGMDSREPESGLKTLNSKKTQKSTGQSQRINDDFERSVELSHELKSPRRFCKVCRKPFPIHFTRHINTHTRDCGVCGKHLQPTESLECHLQAHLTCNICGKRFYSFSEQERHVRIHTGEKPFCCTICGKRFVRNYNLQSHMREHTGKKPYSCTVCGKRFRWKVQIPSHMSCHTGEKPYSCTICGKGYSRKSILNRHMLSHNGEKPFSCTGFDQRFSMNVNQM